MNNEDAIFEYYIISANTSLTKMLFHYVLTSRSKNINFNINVLD